MCFNRDSYKTTKTILIISALAIFVFIVGSTTAIILEQKYNFNKQFLSELGVRYTPSSSADSTLRRALFPEVFNITLIVTGLLISPFFIGVYITLKPEKLIQKIFFLGTAVVGIFSGITLSLVGVFDLGYFYYAHMIVTGLFYMGAMVTSLLWGLGVIFLSKDSPYKMSKIWKIEPLTVSIIVGLGLITSTFAQSYPEIFGFITLALYQKIFVYALFALMTLIIIRFFRLLKKEKLAKKVTSS